MADQKKIDPLALQISQRDIDAALRSVERANIQSEPAEPQESNPDEQAAQLRADLLQARQALRQREAELELSQEMGRKTLEKLREEHERGLRTLADFDNLRKRVGREREEHAKFSQEMLLRELLPVLDNFDRALDHASSPADFDGLASGLKVTRKLLEDLLGRHGVRAISAVQQPFDPRVHEAMQSVESVASPGTVMTEMLRGYMLHERLLRPAMVVVSRAADRPPSDVRDGDQAQAAPSANDTGAPASKGS